MGSWNNMLSEKGHTFNAYISWGLRVLSLRMRGLMGSWARGTTCHTYNTYAVSQFILVTVS
jgi:hypothetical protein